jgi:hypothetical protein
MLGAATGAAAAVAEVEPDEPDAADAGAAGASTRGTPSNVPLNVVKLPNTQPCWPSPLTVTWYQEPSWFKPVIANRAPLLADDITR